MNFLAKEIFQNQTETTELPMQRLLMQGRYARSHAFHVLWRGFWKDAKPQRNREQRIELKK
ncbi:hypothetical protein SAMN04488518_107289 [Pseudovibrio ascidiaceicola]|uniref:Uncharacterized protein n=1 Tax=Pseudovibrio ascidiaceicola TaxID=285279 RepID=A0A1I4BF65_9HYPH|nr:hypothetical protein SAMN04488518_107289 [Pseudovibrio ascidiaceicola]